MIAALIRWSVHNRYLVILATILFVKSTYHSSKPSLNRSAFFVGISDKPSPGYSVHSPRTLRTPLTAWKASVA